jgi:methionyl-tRNA formyltransferase
MQVAFAGTPRFAAQALEALLASRHRVAAVWTQPDRPAGRGLQAQASDVKQVAQAAGLAVHQPVTLKDAEAVAPLAAVVAAGVECLVVAAYGLLLPQHVLDLFPRGCLNIHASLLPRWRGAAPIQRAIEAGDAETGICLMRMEAGLDTGPVYRCARLPIAPDDTGATLHDRLAALGARVLVETLDALEHAAWPPQPQAAEGVTYARKLTRADAALDWTREALALERQVRAFDPVPGAHATFDGAPLKVWAAQAESNVAVPAPPGTVLAVDADSVCVACAPGSGLRLRVVQQPGGRRLAVRDWLRGRPLAPGARFEPGAR